MSSDYHYQYFTNRLLDNGGGVSETRGVREKLNAEGAFHWTFFVATTLWHVHYAVNRSPISNVSVAVCVNIFFFNNSPGPISVTARSKAWFCGRSLAGIAGSNPAEGMGICLL
jgi:hypothetical protein